MDKKEVLNRVLQDFQYSQLKKEQETIETGIDGHEDNYASQRRIRIYYEWYNSIQWEHDKRGNSFDARDYVSTPTVNFIKTIVDQRTNAFKRRKIYIDVVPSAVENEIIAIGWQQILRRIWRLRGFSNKLALVYKDGLIAGAGFFKIIWDDRVKSIDIVPLDPLDVYPDPYARTMSDMRYIHLVFVKPKEYIMQKYNITDEAYKKAPNEPEILYESWYRSVFGEPVCITWTKDRILDIKPVRKITGSDEFPIFSIVPNKTTRRFWGSSLVEFLIDSQNLHNKSLGLLLDALLISNNGRIWTTDKDVQISNDPREIIYVNSKESIGVLPLNMANPQWFSIVQYSGYGLMQQLSQTFATNAGQPSNQRTASGVIAILQAGNLSTDSDLTEIAFDINSFGKVLVDMVKMLYTKDEIRTMLGSKFEGADTFIDLMDEDISLLFDLSDPLPEDKLARNNLLAGLLAQNKIDLMTFAKLTENTQLIEILQQQESQNQMPTTVMPPQTPQGIMEQVLQAATQKKENIEQQTSEVTGGGTGVGV